MSRQPNGSVAQALCIRQVIGNLYKLCTLAAFNVLSSCGFANVFFQENCNFLFAVDIRL